MYTYICSLKSYNYEIAKCTTVEILASTVDFHYRKRIRLFSNFHRNSQKSFEKAIIYLSAWITNQVHRVDPIP